MNTTTATKTLPATLVPVPDAFPWNLRNYTDDIYTGSASVELVRDGRVVVVAQNDGRGGMSELEIQSRGDDDVLARERQAIKDVLTGFHEAALKYKMDGTPFGGSVTYLDYDEERLADLLLAEGEQVKKLSRGRNVLVAKSRANLDKGTFHSLRKSSHLSDEEGLEAAKKVCGPGALVWSRGSRQWLGL